MCYDFSEDEENVYVGFTFTELLEKDQYFKFNNEAIPTDEYTVYKSYYINKSVLTMYVHESFNIITNPDNSIVFLEFTFAHDNKLYRWSVKGLLKNEIDIKFSQKECTQPIKKTRKPRAKKIINK